MPDADPLIAEIVKVAREKCPEAAAVYVYPPDCSWDDVSGLDYSAALVVAYDAAGDSPLRVDAPTLAELLVNLKENRHE